MCLHHLLILYILIRVFNCLSTFSLKSEYTPKFSKSLKLGKSAKPEYPPQNPEKTVKMRNYTPNVEHGSAPLSASIFGYLATPALGFETLEIPQKVGTSANSKSKFPKYKLIPPPPPLSSLKPHKYGNYKDI